MPQKIEISHKTIIFTVLFLALLWFLYFIRDIILVFFVALLIMAILNPSVSRLARLHIPRVLAVILIYLLTIGILGLVISILVPTFVEQTGHLLSLFPSLFQNIKFLPAINDSLMNQIAGQVGSVSASALKFTISAFSNIVSLVSVLVMAFYLLLSRDKFEQNIENFFGKAKEKKIKSFLSLWERNLGSWMRGQLLLMLSIGVLTFIGLSILRVPFAVPLSILAGLLEIVPIIGPLISAIPAAVVGFNISLVLGITVLILYFAVQQIENHLLAPKIMEKSTGVNPVIVLLCLAIGMRISGVIGVLLAIPVYLTLKLLFKFYLLR